MRIFVDTPQNVRIIINIKTTTATERRLEMGFIDRHKAKAQIKGYDLVQDESAETVTIVKKFSRQSVESFSGVTVASAVMMASRKIDEMPVLSLGDQ